MAGEGIGPRQPHPVAGPRAAGDIAAPADVQALLRTFYEAALADDLLGPVFRTAGMRLETHLPRIAAFWEVTLFGTNTYSGSPLALHGRAAVASGLGQAHFTRWLALWERTVASLFAGPIATRAVAEAQRMAVGMLRDLERHPSTDTCAAPGALVALRGTAPERPDAS